MNTVAAADLLPGDVIRLRGVDLVVMQVARPGPRWTEVTVSIDDRLLTRRFRSITKVPRF
jgi:hypothetical protein